MCGTQAGEGQVVFMESADELTVVVENQDFAILSKDEEEPCKVSNLNRDNILFDMDSLFQLGISLWIFP